MRPGQRQHLQLWRKAAGLLRPVIAPAWSAPRSAPDGPACPPLFPAEDAPASARSCPVPYHPPARRRGHGRAGTASSSALAADSHAAGHAALLVAQPAGCLRWIAGVPPADRHRCRRETASDRCHSARLSGLPRKAQSAAAYGPLTQTDR